MGLKAALRRHLPKRYVNWRVRHHQRRVRRRAGATAVAEAFARRHGCEVGAGPCAGLRYPARFIGEIDAPVAKLVGAYERELRSALDSAAAAAPATMVNIGAAEGYYAVGFALRSPATRVVAFESDPRMRALCSRLAAYNGVGDRVLVRGACTSNELIALAPAGAFVLCDCEGGEVEIFTEPAIERLRSSTLLIELHDEQAGVDVLSVLGPRFERTHTVTTIERQPRDAQEYPALAALSPDGRALALGEFRASPISWALFTPASGRPGYQAPARVTRSDTAPAASRRTNRTLT